jgi:type I restriction enzyme, S subunit
MSDLPKGWATCRLQDAIEDIQAGFASGKKDVEGGLFHLRMNNISVDGNLNLELLRTVPQSLASHNHTLKDGDVLICTTNSGKLVGKCALFDLEGHFAFSNHLTRLRVNPNTIESKYLLHQLWLLWKRGDFEHKCKHWVNQSTLPKEELLSSEILLAPLNEQRRIVAKVEKLLSRVDAAQARLVTISHIAKRFRQSVLAAACSGRLTADWRNENRKIEPASELLKRIKALRLERSSSKKETTQIEAAFSSSSNDDENLEVPPTWAFCSIGDAGTVSNGSTPSRKVSKYWDGTLHWVSSGEVRNNIISTTRECITRQGFDNSSVRILPPGTILLAMIGEGKTRGQTAMLEIEATINQNIAAIDLSHEQIVPTYLWRWFQYQYEITREQGSGSGPQALNCQRVRELPLLLPPLAEQQEIVNRLEALFKTADALEARYGTAKAHVDKLTQSILAKAFRGELVPQDPNDESASILLDRIRRAAAAAVLPGRQERKRASRRRGN